MAITINTNMSSLIVQSNLNSATNMLNKSIERMTTGYKINHAKDNAAGYSISKNWEIKLSSLDVASENAATSSDMLTTIEDTYSLISGHMQRIRDLTEQASNGTYGSESLKAIKSEITARLNEIDRIANNSEFNGLKLMDGSITNDISLQVGLYADASSKINLSSNLFKKSTVTSLFGEIGGMGKTTIAQIAESCSGYTTKVVGNQSAMLENIDAIIKEISNRSTDVGSTQNRVDSAMEAIDVQSENITSSLSTIRDADIASESSNFVKAQILQQASATLLATANQAPSIALSLI